MPILNKTLFGIQSECKHGHDAYLNICKLEQKISKNPHADGMSGRHEKVKIKMDTHKFKLDNIP